MPTISAVELVTAYSVNVNFGQHMKNSELQYLIGAEITAIGVLRHHRTAAEFMQKNEATGCLEVSELLFLKPRSTIVTFLAKRWFGNLRSVTIHRLTEESAPLQKYELKFDAGSWVVVAENHTLNVFQSIAEAPLP